MGQQEGHGAMPLLTRLDPSQLGRLQVWEHPLEVSQPFGALLLLLLLL